MASPTLNATFTLDRHRNAAAQIYEFLRARIVTLELPPGATLARPELAQCFNVSVTPVRDALLLLEEEGLVDVFPQHATRVRAIDIDSARQAHFLRLTLELEVARTLSERHGRDLPARLHALVERQRACWERRDLDGFVACDHDFHKALFSAAGMERLWHLARARSGNMDRLRRLHLPLNGKAESVLQEHAAVADAIARGNPALAEQCMRRHLGGTMAGLAELRQRYPGYLTG